MPQISDGSAYYGYMPECCNALRLCRKCYVLRSLSCTNISEEEHRERKWAGRNGETVLPSCLRVESEGIVDGVIAGILERSHSKSPVRVLLIRTGTSFRFSGHLGESGLVSPYQCCGRCLLRAFVVK